MALPSAEQLHDYCAHTFRLAQERRLSSKEEAVSFVDERGFVFFWPIKDILMPSLWSAVAGDRPVANAHDDPGHVTWGWKDDMLDKRQWYYGKILRGRATMISLDVAPVFYALSENYGEPELDYLQLYQDGLMTREAKVIYETILERGPIDTVTLRREARMTSRKSNSPFNRAMTYLQRDFKILPVGVSESGGWNYSFIYAAVHRHYPELPQEARSIGRSEARRRLVTLYLASVGVAGEGDVRKVFQWRLRDVRQTLGELVARGTIEVVDEGGDTRYLWPGLREVVDSL